MCEIKVETFINHQTQLKLPEKPGVWFLTGIVRDHEVKKKRVVLQVAQTNNLFNEIKRNVSLLSSIPCSSKSSDNETYVSHFGQVLFNYPKSGSRLEYLYGEIFNKYKELEFHYLELTDNKIMLLLIEKYIAYRTGAIYWAHSRPFGGKVEDNKENRLEKALELKEFLKSTLLDDIDDYLQKEGLL